MMTRFCGTDEFLKALQDSKFPAVMVPMDWKFCGTVSTEVIDGAKYLKVKDELFRITAEIQEWQIMLVEPGDGAIVKKGEANG